MMTEAQENPRLSFNAFNKKQSQLFAEALQKTHGNEFYLVSYIAVGETKLTHFEEEFGAKKRKTIAECHAEFRKRVPLGRYFLAIVVGQDIPEHPPKSQPFKRRLAELNGTFRPEQKAEVLMLDTRWMDKAFRYRKI